MLITKTLFHEILAGKGRHNLIFMGMSGVGKTFWSQKLAERYGLCHKDYDLLISHSSEFIRHLQDIPGEKATERLATLLGNPWDEGFATRERRYLDIECRLMAEDELKGVIEDLTGSAIYCQKAIAQLAAKGIVVYLEVSENAIDEMIAVFVSDPKPICWNGAFERKKGESNEEALRRCFPLLLKKRIRLYEKYADVTLAYEAHKHCRNAEELAEAILMRLE